MTDLISRAAAIKGILSMCPEKTEPGSFDEYGVSVLCGAVDLVIKGLPAVDAAPVVHGRWQEKHVDYASDCAIDEVQTAKCSVCGLYHTTPYLYYFKDFKYCPNCGAKMHEERRDGE